MTRPCNITVFGATGRMGGEIISAIDNGSDTKLVGASSGINHRQAGKEISSGSGIQLSDPRKAIDAANVVIDFSLPAGVSENLQLCVDHKIPYVCGVTGLADEIQKEFDAAASHIAVLWSPNMSIGVNLCLQAAQDIAAGLGGEFGVHILDIHHAGKKDAPSGTALEFARQIRAAAKKPPEIDIESIREGQNPGEHQVRFTQGDQVIEIRHQAGSRHEFAAGAVRAAQWLIDQPPGRYSMRNLSSMTKSA